MRTNRSEFRANVKAHRYVMDAPSVAAIKAKRDNTAAAFWFITGLLTLAVAACAVDSIIAATLHYFGA